MISHEQRAVYLQCLDLTNVTLFTLPAVCDGKGTAVYRSPETFFKGLVVSMLWEFLTRKDVSHLKEKKKFGNLWIPYYFRYLEQIVK